MAEHRNQIRWLDDPELMEWLCAARLDLMRHMYAPLMGKPKLRDKVFGLIKAGLRVGQREAGRLTRNLQLFRRLPSTAADTPSTTSAPPAASVRSSHWCMLLLA